MYLSRHQSAAGPRWALEGRYLRRTSRWSVCSRCLAWMSQASWRIWVPKDRPKTRSCHRLSRHTRSGPAGDLPAEQGGPRAGVDGRRRLREGLRRRAARALLQGFGVAGRGTRRQRARPRRQPLERARARASPGSTAGWRSSATPRATTCPRGTLRARTHCISRRPRSTTAPALWARYSSLGP